MFGGRQTERDYAPHLWIGDHYVGETAVGLKCGKYIYRVGRNAREDVVAERIVDHGHPDQIYDGKVVGRRSVRYDPDIGERTEPEIKDCPASSHTSGYPCQEYRWVSPSRIPKGIIRAMRGVTFEHREAERETEIREFQELTRRMSPTQ